MTFNSFKYPFNTFLFFLIIYSISPNQLEAFPQKPFQSNNTIDQLLTSVNEKLYEIANLLAQIDKFKEYAHEKELEKIDDLYTTGTKTKNNVEKELGPINEFLDTVTDENVLNDKSGEIITQLNGFIIELNEKINVMTVFINKFNQILYNKKRVLTQINSTSKKLLSVQKKLKFIQNNVDVNTLLIQLQSAEKKQETARNEFERNNIQQALNYTLKVRNIVNEIYQKYCSIEHKYTFKKQLTNFLEYTSDMLEHFKKNTLKNASSSIQKKFNRAQNTQENACLIVENNPETAMYMAREARKLLLELNGFYQEDMDSNETFSKKQPVDTIEHFEKVTPPTDKADIVWNISTSGNAFYDTYASKQYITMNNDVSLDNISLDSRIQEFDLSGYLSTSLQWLPNIPIIKILKPNISISNSQCNIGNDITLEFFNKLVTVNNILDKAILFNQEIKDSSNSVYCELELEIKKNFPIFSFDISSDVTFEEFTFPRIGYIPYKKYSFYTDLYFNSRDLSKSFLFGFTYSFYEYHNTGKGELIERDYSFYEPNFEICFWSNTNSFILDGFFNLETYVPSITKGYLNPAKIQNGKLDACLLSQPFQWLNIELKGDYNFQNTLINDKEFNLSDSDTNNVISQENQYLHTYSISPNFTIKPYSNLGLSLLFGYEGQKFKITPEIDTLHTLKSYYALIQGMRLFYENKNSLLQIAYTFSINNITQKGEYNSESNYRELQLPIEWYWNPLEWLTINFETVLRFQKKTEKQTQKLKPEKYYSISLNCKVQF